MAKRRQGGRINRRDRARIINVFETAEDQAQAKRLKQRREKRRNKVRSDIPGTRALVRRPELTDALALELVKLLHSGIPPVLAIAYFAPDHYDGINEQARKEWAQDWLRSPRVAAAVAAFNKGSWHELSKDDRLQLALDKHLAELAYFLMNTPYADAQGTELKKLGEARDAITAVLKQAEGDVETPWMRAMRELLTEKLDQIGPPQLPSVVPASLKDQN